MFRFYCGFNDAYHEQDQNQQQCLHNIGLQYLLTLDGAQGKRIS